MNYQKDFQEVFSSELKELDELIERLKELGIEMPERLQLVARTLIEKGDGAVDHYVEELNRKGNSSIKSHVGFICRQISLLYVVATADPGDLDKVRSASLNSVQLETTLPGGKFRWDVITKRPAFNLVADLRSTDLTKFTKAKKFLANYIVTRADERAKNLFRKMPEKAVELTANIES